MKANELIRPNPKIQQAFIGFMNKKTALEESNQSSFLKNLVYTALLWYGLYKGFGYYVNQEVIDNAIEEYKITQKYGTPMEQKIHAELVAQAYLQAHDAKNYRLWSELANPTDNAPMAP